MASLLLWWLLIEFLSLLALPLTLALLRHLPDRGYPFARVLGVLLPAFLAWLLGMWQLASYGPGLLVLCLLVVAGISGLLLWKDRSIVQFLRQSWRLVLLYEVLFAVALLAGAILRIYASWNGPAISHTEQPMDFAFMNGILQSRTLPPQDPWLSGYIINYYYLGYFIAASLTMLSGLPSSITFNLNLALLFALAVTGCFSLGYNLTMAVAPAAPATATPTGPPRKPSQRRAAVVGLVAALLAMVVANQAGAMQVLTGSNQVVALGGGEMATVLGDLLAGQRAVLPLGHVVNTGGEFGGKWDSLVPTNGHQVDDFDWWWPSRVLWDERPSLEAVEQISASGQTGGALLDWRRYVSTDQVTRSYAITEFPFFSFYLGDMHPHVMSLPLILLALSLALSVLLAPERGRPALGPGRWSWLFLVVTAVVLGGLYVANSWDFPTYLLIYAAAWTWRWRRDVAERWTRRDSLALLRDLGILVGLCIFLYLPFYLTFRSLVGNKDIPAEILSTPVLGTIARLPILSKLLQTVGPVFWDKTSLYTLLVIFGLFLYPALSWLAIKGVRRWGPGRREPAGEGRAPAGLRRSPFFGRILRFLGLVWRFLGLVWDRVFARFLWGWAVLAICVVLAVLLHFPLLLLVPIMVLGWKLLKTSQPAEAMVLFMLLVALLVIVGCDLVYIRDIYGESRMNTVFKFYYQAWMLLAIAGAWACGEITRAYLRRPLGRALWAIPLLLLLAGGLVYPVLSLRLAFRAPHEWTLDGLAYMQQQYSADYAGIRWLQEHAAPDAVVLEAVGGEWGYAGRVASATGRPALLGWDGHEMQWRGGQPEALAEIVPRRDAARRIYETASAAEARQLLWQYEVDYIFVGTLETTTPAEGLAKLAQLGTLVFEAPGVQIYQVNR